MNTENLFQDQQLKDSKSSCTWCCVTMSQGVYLLTLQRNVLLTSCDFTFFRTSVNTCPMTQCHIVKDSTSSSSLLYESHISQTCSLIWKRNACCCTSWCVRNSNTHFFCLFAPYSVILFGSVVFRVFLIQGNIEDSSVLGCDAVSLNEWFLPFWRIIVFRFTVQPCKKTFSLDGLTLKVRHYVPSKLQ